MNIELLDRRSMGFEPVLLCTGQNKSCRQIMWKKTNQVLIPVIKGFSGSFLQIIGIFGFLFSKQVQGSALNGESL